LLQGARDDNGCHAGLPNVDETWIHSDACTELISGLVCQAALRWSDGEGDQSLTQHLEDHPCQDALIYASIAAALEAYRMLWPVREQATYSVARGKFQWQLSAEMGDKSFARLYRLSKATFLLLWEQVQATRIFEARLAPTRNCETIVWLAAVLRHFATGGCLMQTASELNVAYSCIGAKRHDFAKAICEARRAAQGPLVLPDRGDIAAWRLLAATNPISPGFEKATVSGDGTLSPVQLYGAPASRREAFLCRKGVYAQNIMLWFCGALRIRQADVAWEGRTCDQGILNRTTALEHIPEGFFGQCS